jgi:hydrogenase maturation protein HypF
MGHMATRAQIVVKGIVQGVGFRPFVFNLAETLGLKGYVTNSTDGVLIDVEGSRLDDFVERIRSEAPPLSQITDVSMTTLPLWGYQDFSIHASIEQAGNLPFTLISPDVSVCDDCLREMLDPSDRRFLYPFINCINCGPRFSLTLSVPYDRPNTTMAAFAMCPDCLREYSNPRDRRFHAQPNACHVCGPEVEFRMRNAECGMRNGEAVKGAVNLLKNGGIVAIKGLGGFHIACDAANDLAVKRLRENKRKSNKPFAVMAPTVEHAGRFCRISADERSLLLSKRRPVVLLQKKPGQCLSEAASPGNSRLGVMLPYTPLHFLLFYHPLGSGLSATEPHFDALVMTSGNLSEEPIVRDNDEAVEKLSGIVDGFLLHNRDIFMRVDDSIVRMRNSECGMRNKEGIEKSTDAYADSQNSAFRIRHSELSFIRRSRGFAPDPIMLPDEGPEVLGCGADLKNTFTLTKGRFAIPSQHIGDMENYETLKFFEESLANLKTVYRAEPVAIAHDLHPGYLSTQWAIEFGIRNAECGIKDVKSAIQLFTIQHHYAHIGSVMAEHGLKTPVIGVAFDGTGYGTDGNLWGGEFLIADIDGFERAGQFRYVSLPGGEAAIREPWKTAVSYVVSAFGQAAGRVFDDIGFSRKYGIQTIEQLMIIAKSRDFSPLSSGAGRLFDAVSALIGVCDHNTFEGEAAMALEALTREGSNDEYVVELKRENSYTVVDYSAAISGITRDLGRGVSREVIATKFHNTVATVVRTLVGRIREQSGIRDVALSGGTFQNRYLLDRVIRLLSQDGMRVFTNGKVPCNDGGISLGQAYLVRERLRKCGMRNSECGV